MTLVILASVNRETMDYNCPTLGITSSPFKMKYITVENGESMKHSCVREWLSVVHNLWGLLKYFTSPSWNFKSYEVKFKEWSMFLLYWFELVFVCGKHSVITSITTRCQYCDRLIPMWPSIRFDWTRVTFGKVSVGKNPRNTLRRKPHFAVFTILFRVNSAFEERPLYLIWEYKFYFSSI